MIDEGSGDGEPGSPRSVYERRSEARGAELSHWSRLEKWTSAARLVMVLLAFALAWFAIQEGLFSPLWAFVPVVLFVVLLSVHERLLLRAERARRSVEFYRLGLLRLDDRWIGEGDAGERYTPPADGEHEHLYALDLDLFGRGSLFELLSTARTASGSDTLASWLLGPASVDEARARQRAVGELRERLDLREDTYTLGARVEENVSGSEALAVGAWAALQRQLPAAIWLRPLLILAALSNIVAAVGWAVGWWGGTPLLALGTVQVACFLLLRQRVQEVVKSVERSSRDLAVIAELLDRFEGESFDADWLASRVDELRGDSSEAEAPGKTVARLQRLVDLLDSRRNPMFAPFSIFLWWGTQLALALERWRTLHGDRVRRWIELVGELEAVIALANYAAEHPDDPFPDLSDDAEPLLSGRRLGHPLLPSAACVRNDVDLGAGRRALVISGSNMSGKSTFLRSCGVNVVLALAGAPVRAGSFRLSRLRVGASIRIQDSLMEGASRFYAEITRLRRIVELADGDEPALFLLDEILHGTNSHDRRIGAEAVIRTLVEKGSIGLVTTHDLALAEIAEASSRLENVHFVDELVDGRVSFDYRLRPGVVTRSNALELMREVGLDV